MWKPVKDYPDYKISDKGEIKRVTAGQGTKVGRLLKGTLANSGYMTVSLSDKGASRTFLLHRLVAIHFVEGYEEGLECDHKDENKLNNAADNLQWITPKENTNRSIGGKPSHRRHWCWNYISLIKRLYDDGLTFKEIGSLFGCTKTAPWNAYRSVYG